MRLRGDERVSSLAPVAESETGEDDEADAVPETDGAGPADA